MTGAIVATSLVVWPAAPFFLFMHGKDTTIPKGTEITAYVNGNMPLDAMKFGAPPSNVAASPAISPQTNQTNAQLEVTSTPPGADNLGGRQLHGRYTVRANGRPHAYDHDFEAWLQTLGTQC